MRFTEESRYYLCRQLVQQFDCPIDRGVFADICVLFPGPNFTSVIIPAQVAWSFQPVRSAVYALNMVQLQAIFLRCAKDSHTESLVRFGKFCIM